MTSPPLTQAIFSAVMLLVSYFAYTSLAAPWIEGAPVDSGADAAEAAEDTPYFDPPAARFEALIQPLFPEGSWERNEAKVLKADRLLLLLKDYHVGEDQRLHISPCTIVLLPPGEETPLQQSWVIQAVEGAVLEFDDAGDLHQGKLGKIVTAFVPGTVQIRGTLPESGEAVFLTSRNLQFDDNRVWTPHEIDLRVGHSRMAGRDFTVILNELGTASSSEASDRLPGTVNTPVRSIELVQLQQLHIDPSDGWGKLLAPEFRQVPVDVTCGGSLLVDVIGGVARLTKQVCVDRRTSDQVFDKLTCDELYAMFGSQPPSVPGEQPQPIALKRIAARGAPARLTTRQQPADPLHQFESPELAYDFGDTGGFSAAGPGRYQANAAETNEAASAGQVSGAATWQKQLQWRDSGHQAVLQLEGQAAVDAPAWGRVQAEQLGVQLVRDPSRIDQFAALEPKHLWGAGTVMVDTPRFVARAHTMEIDLIAQTAPSSPTSTEPGPRLNPPQSGPHADPTQPPSRFQVSGGAVKAMVTGRGAATAIKSLTIDGGVTCLEIRGSGQQAVSGVEMRGDRLTLRDFSVDRGTAVIQGSPARIRARQVDIEGQAVHLDRAANRVWVHGTGFARLPLPAQVAQQLAHQVPQATLTWRDRMEFDGRTVTCGDQVTLSGPLQRIWCTQLSAELREPIDLSGARLPEVAVNKVEAQGGVRIENKTMGAQGLESLDTIQLVQLSIWPETGELTGVGPGSLETVRFGRGMALAVQPGAAGQEPAPHQLVYLGVDFQQKLEGNLHQRQIDFRERVRATFGPVTDWQQRLRVEDPRLLPEGGLMMTCQQLSVFQIVKRFHDGLPIEITALGNVLIQGGEFAAQAHRMSYDQAKDLLVLEGQGRANAKLWRHGGAGQAATQAQKIQFWPQSKRVKLDGFQGAVWGGESTASSPGGPGTESR